MASGSTAKSSKRKKAVEVSEDQEMEPQPQHKPTNKQINELIPLLAKVACSQAQAIREDQSVLYDTVLIPAKMGMVEAVKASTQKWSEMVQKDGKGHKHGPPHIPAFTAAIEWLCEQDVGARNKATLLGYCTILAQMSPLEKSIKVRAFRILKCYQQDYKKVTMALQGGEEELKVRLAILSSLEQLQGEVKQGRAPAGALERAVQKALDNMKK